MYVCMYVRQIRAAVNAIQGSPQQQTPATIIEHPASLCQQNPDVATTTFVNEIPVLCLQAMPCSTVSMPCYGHAALDVPATYVKHI